MTVEKILNYNQVAHEIIPEWKAIMDYVDDFYFIKNVILQITASFGVYNSHIDALTSIINNAIRSDYENVLDKCIDTMEVGKDLFIYNDFDLIKVKLTYTEISDVNLPEKVEITGAHGPYGWLQI